MSYSSSLPFSSKLFQLTTLTCALALAGCGGGDDAGGDTIAPKPDLGVQQPSTDGSQGDGTDDGQTPIVEADFFLQRLTVTPNIIELADTETLFTVTVKAVQTATSGAVVNKEVNLSVENSASNGITIEGPSTTVTDSEGNAVYRLKLNPQAVTDQAALLANGFNLVATANKADGSQVTQTSTVRVSRQGSGGGVQVIDSQLDIDSLLTTSSVSNNVLNAYGDTAQLSVVAKDSNGARVSDVEVGLGIANIEGVAIVGGNNQTTDIDGIANFSLRIDSNLTEADRNQLIQQGIIYTVNIRESSGATKSQTQTLPVALPINDYTINVANISTPLNAYGDARQLTVSATRRSTDVPTDIQGAKVSIRLNDNISGVSLSNQNLVLDANGQASLTLDIADGLDKATRDRLATDGISYTIVLTEPNGASTTRTLNRSVFIPEQQYRVNFNSADKRQLSSSGGSAVISFRVNNLAGGIIAGQEVTAKLPNDLIAAGLLTLDTDSKQITDNQGQVSYTVRVPNNLTSSQKTTLENAGTFVLTANIKEPLGITSEATSARVAIGSDIGQSDIRLTTQSLPTVVSVLAEQFKLQVIGKRLNGSAAIGRSVKLVLDEATSNGVTIIGNEIVTNNSGIAEFSIGISQSLTPAQRQSLISSGIRYTAVLTDTDGTQSRITQTVQVQQPATGIEFTSITTPIISELGGRANVSATLRSIASNQPIENQVITTKLGSTAIRYGVTITSTQSTDFAGNAIFEVNIPAGLSANDRAELKRTGISYQLSYVENGVTYDSAIQKVTISNPIVNLKVLNAPNNINNQAGYILNNVGSTASIQAQLSNQSSNEQIVGQPVRLEINNSALASLLTVNGQIGSSTITTTTNDNGLVSFNVVVPSNLTTEQKQALSNQILTATLTETLTGKEQQVNIRVQSMAASISLLATAPQALNLNGGNTQIEVVARDAQGNISANQTVFLALPASVASQGITLVSGGQQTTDASGKAIFTLAVPNNLTDTQKQSLVGTFVVGLSAADTNGNIVTQTLSVRTETPAGTTETLSIGTNKVVNTQGDTFKVFVRATDNDNSIANREVRLNVNDPIRTGVSVSGNGIATTNSDGVATFDLTLTKGANVDQAILEAGIGLTATTTTAENVSLTQSYIVAVDTATVESYQILVSSDKPTLITGGDQTNAIFRVTDSSGGILVGVPVQLSIQNLEASGAALTTPSVVTTDAQGKIEVGVLLAANTVNARLNHSVVIDAKIITPQYDENGVVTFVVREENTLSLSAVGTTIELEASSTQLKDDDTTTITTVLTDGAGVAIVNATMDLVNADNTVITDSVITNAVGEATFTLNESELTFDANGNLRVFARASGERALITQRSINSIDLVKVSQAGISFIDIADVYDANESQTINIQVRTDTPAQAQALIGRSIQVETSLGTFGNNNVISTRVIAAANVNGNIITVPVNLRSTLAGTAVLQATVLGETVNGQPRYQTTVDTRFRATTPTKMLFQAVKSVIVPGSSTEVVATVKDANDVPVEGQTVVFSRTSDSSAGRLSAATAVTDSKGQARVVYQANASSPIGGVVINARLLDATFNVPDATTTITVSQDAVFTTLAFSNVVSSDNIYYTKNVSISVVDGSGRAVPNKEVSIQSFATEYAQGRYCLLDSTVTYQKADEIERNDQGDIIGTTTPEPLTNSEAVAISIPQEFGFVPTEDSNYNFILDRDPILNEDRNNNGTLEAINPVAIIGGEVSDDGYTFITNDEGRADFQIRYPLRYSNWVKVRFDASTFLNGSESTQSVNYRLPSLDSDLSINGNNLMTPWIDNISPFGTGGAVCTDSISVIVNEQSNSTKVTLSPYKAGQTPYAVSINGVPSSTTSTDFNSYIVDFNQAFAIGSTVTVVRNGFDFSRTIKVE